MEGGTFLTRPIQKEFGRFVMIELHTDGRDDKYLESSIRNRELQKDRFKTIGIPYYVLLDPSGQKLYWKAGGVRSEEEFLRKLKEVPDKFE